MSDKPYEKVCTFCKKKIRMSKETRQWLPYELDNGPHECKNKPKNGQTKDKKEITLEMVQRKLGSIGIIINVERLMNQEQ